MGSIELDQEPLEERHAAGHSTQTHVAISRPDCVSFVRPGMRHLVAKGQPNTPCTTQLPPRSLGRFYFVLAITAVYFLCELVIGILYSSLALVADSMHMASDLIALTIGLYTVRAASLPAHAKATFGGTRAEIVGGLINASFMMSICLLIAIEAVQKIASWEVGSGTNLHDGNDVVLGAALGGLAINVVGIVLLGGAAPSTDSLKKDTNMRGVFLHLIADALGSVSVIMSSLIIKYSTSPHRWLADPLFSLAIVLFLIIATWPLIQESSQILLQRTPPHIDVHDVIRQLMDVPSVIGVAKFHLWTLSGTSLIASMHVLLEGDVPFDEIAARFTAILDVLGVSSVTLHPVYVRDDDRCQITIDAMADDST